MRRSCSDLTQQSGNKSDPECRNGWVPFSRDISISSLSGPVPFKGVGPRMCATAAHQCSHQFPALIISLKHLFAMVIVQETQDSTLSVRNMDARPSTVSLPPPPPLLTYPLTRTPTHRTQRVPYTTPLGKTSKARPNRRIPTSQIPTTSDMPSSPSQSWQTSASGSRASWHPISKNRMRCPLSFLYPAPSSPP